MDVKAFNPQKHYEEINKWLFLRELPSLDLATFPSTTWIIEDICSISLYVTNANIGLLENFVSNPYADQKDIYEAFHALFAKAESEAKALGLTTLWGFTALPRVLELSKMRGYVSKNKSFQQVTKELI